MLTSCFRNKAGYNKINTALNAVTVKDNSNEEVDIDFVVRRPMSPNEYVNSLAQLSNALYACGKSAIT